MIKCCQSISYQLIYQKVNVSLIRILIKLVVGKFSKFSKFSKFQFNKFALAIPSESIGMKDAIL